MVGAGRVVAVAPPEFRFCLRDALRGRRRRAPRRTRFASTSRVSPRRVQAAAGAPGIQILNFGPCRSQAVLLLSEGPRGRLVSSNKPAAGFLPVGCSGGLERATSWLSGFANVDFMNDSSPICLPGVAMAQWISPRMFRELYEARIM